MERYFCHSCDKPLRTLECTTESCAVCEIESNDDVEANDVFILLYNLLNDLQTPHGMSPLQLLLTMSGTPGVDNLQEILNRLFQESGEPVPSPMAQDEIDKIPTVNIEQHHIDKELQCYVCLENFTLGEPVCQLACKHLYHDKCIVPWLQHISQCPICR